MTFPSTKDDDIKKIISAMYPKGFLLQLGQSIGKEVKLSDQFFAGIEYYAGPMRVKTTVGVIAKDNSGSMAAGDPAFENVGELQISDYGQVGIYLHYRGVNPLDRQAGFMWFALAL